MDDKKPITIMIEVADMADPVSNYSISAPEVDMPDDDDLYVLLIKIAQDIRCELGPEH